MPRVCSDFGERFGSELTSSTMSSEDRVYGLVMWVENRIGIMSAVDVTKVAGAVLDTDVLELVLVLVLVDDVDRVESLEDEGAACQSLVTEEVTAVLVAVPEVSVARKDPINRGIDVLIGYSIDNVPICCNDIGEKLLTSRVVETLSVDDDKIEELELELLEVVLVVLVVALLSEDGDKRLVVVLESTERDVELEAKDAVMESNHDNDKVLVELRGLDEPRVSGDPDMLTKEGVEEVRESVASKSDQSAEDEASSMLEELVLVELDVSTLDDEVSDVADPTEVADVVDPTEVADVVDPTEIADVVNPTEEAEVVAELVVVLSVEEA
ncbi:hypothetical protein GGI06_001396, partial [Coemansia sp. S85]